MRLLLIASIALLVGALIALQKSLGIAPSDVANIVRGWPVGQQLAVAAIVVVVMVLLVVAIWQSARIVRQASALEILQNRMTGLRDATSGAADEQNGADAAVRHLIGTDPVSTIDDVQKRLGQAEVQTAQQSAQNSAVDLQSRIDEIRRRQQALRSQLGSVSEKRRVVEPMLNEVKERQGLIDRALAELEKDETGKGVDKRLEEAEAFLNRAQTRLQTLEAIFAKFEQLRDHTSQLQSNTEPLRNVDSGLKSRHTEVAELQRLLDATLVSLEKHDEEAIGERLDRLSKRKTELEQRIAALNDSFGSLEALRQDIGDHFEKLNASLGSHLKR